MAYVPSPTPEKVTSDYLMQELLRISAQFDLIFQGRFLEVSASPPVKPREGMLAVADGTHWNPGSGKGLYEYRSGSWAKL